MVERALAFVCGVVALVVDSIHAVGAVVEIVARSGLAIDFNDTGKLLEQSDRTTRALFPDRRSLALWLARRRVPRRAGARA